MNKAEKDSKPRALKVIKRTWEATDRDMNLNTGTNHSHLSRDEHQIFAAVKILLHREASQRARRSLAESLTDQDWH